MNDQNWLAERFEADRASASSGSSTGPTWRTRTLPPTAARSSSSCAQR